MRKEDNISSATCFSFTLQTNSSGMFLFDHSFPNSAWLVNFQYDHIAVGANLVKNINKYNKELALENICVEINKKLYTSPFIKLSHFSMMSVPPLDSADLRMCFIN